MAATDIGLKVGHYKAFGSAPQGFDRMLPVNVIIGRNNSGKSTLIDLLEWAARTTTFADPLDLPGGGREGQRPQVWVTQTHGTLLPESLPTRSVEEWMSTVRPAAAVERWRELIPAKKWGSYREFWDPLRLTWQFRNPESVEIVDTVPNELSSSTDVTSLAAPFLKEAVRRKREWAPSFPISGKQFHRLTAERSVDPEPLDGDDSPLTISPRGAGATRLLTRFINDFGLPRHVVEEKLLDSLNQVYKPDASFSAIQVQRLPDERYEVFLVEDQKGAIPLSASGSGLQTVILVLAALDVLPERPDAPRELERWVYAFEELENNLHPALQRRLFWLLRQRAVTEGAMLFLTTHSPVVVDLFAEDEDAQLIHVTHDGVEATATPVLSYSSRRGVLDDLDVRASDLLQANSIVWVEGPTDRMYFNRWLQLWTDGELREGKDYQCVIYGGRLLNHLSAEEPAERQHDAVEILRVNRNAVVLIDSDKRYLRGRLSETKRRLRGEVVSGQGIAWVTKGREIEQYIPHSVFEKLAGREVPRLETYGSVLKYLNRIEGTPKRKTLDKIKLAEAVVPLLNRDDIAAHMDLADRLTEVCNTIRTWNRRPMPASRSS